MNCQVTADGWMGVSVCAVRGFRSAWITVIKLTYVLPGLYPLLVIPQLFFFSFFPNVQPVDYSVAFLHLFVIFSQFPFGRAGSLSHTAHCAAEVRCPGKGYRPQFSGYITFRLFCRFQCDAAHPTVVRRLCWPNSISSKETLVREGHVLPPRRRALL